MVPWQFCAPPKTPAPPPVPDMSCGTPLTFVIVMVCSAVVEPTGTYPVIPVIAEKCAQQPPGVSAESITPDPSSALHAVTSPAPAMPPVLIKTRPQPARGLKGRPGGDPRTTSRACRYAGVVWVGAAVRCYRGYRRSGRRAIIWAGATALLPGVRADLSS